MTKNTLVGKWKQLRGRIKVSWDKFIHPNLGQSSGKYHKFVGLAQETYGDSQARTRKAVNRRTLSH